MQSVTGTLGRPLPKLGTPNRLGPSAFFTLASESAPDFAARMHRDEVLRRRVATMLGLTVEDFGARAAIHRRRPGIPVRGRYRGDHRG